MSFDSCAPSVPLRTMLCALSLSFAGCANQSTLNEVRASSNPKDRAQRSITNFTPALRCMDDMMFTMGTRDVSMMMEEFRDATQRVPVAARDMMTSALSDMTRRSRGVRLSVFGSDQQNLTQVLQQAQKTNAFAVVPQYNIRGSISQMDDGVQKTGGSVGLTLAEALFGARLGSDTKFSVIGLDAAVVDTNSMTLMSGVISKNTTVLSSRDTSAADGQAKLQNQTIGLVFSFDTSRSEGPAQAARNMIELSAVELVGKLIRAPYWRCLGVADNDAEIQREMDDWFFSMDEAERTRFFQERMRERRYYDGALDGRADSAFNAALKDYRVAMKLPAQGAMDEVFFRSFITTPVPRGRVQVSAKPPAGTPPPVVAAAVATEPVLEITTSPAPSRKKGINLLVKVAQAGYVYCYTQDPVTRKIQRVFPNRFVKDPHVEPGKSLQLPGKNGFVLNPAAEFACLHAPKEVYSDLPPPLRWGDFEDIRLDNFQAIQTQFSEASGFPVQLVSKGP